ncbi:DDE-domain-containing protein [Sparassis crispa]|uniref:DDE-domain-containing protein n=1 Tax=Sparassis crispa TaxID=139825 RepID=A0A401GUL8_9APHY|nr:DDE-domain-containing protein [Sparassis crispa]GBE85902.1 DDE-domain-containing protein [Sparassis crispa]
MAKKALPKRVKTLKRGHAKDVKMCEAVATYRQEQAKPEGSRRGARKIAEDLGIPNQWRTIINRANGGRSVQEAHEEQQKLTPAEEAVLVDFLLQSAERGFPQYIFDIESCANIIRAVRLGPECEKVGDDWADRFLNRHHDVLQTHWSKPLDTQRAQAMNPEAKKKWFELVEKFVVQQGIRPEDLYAMDETGCPPSDQGTSCMVGARGSKTQHKQGGSNRENVTALVTICADGTTLHPTIVFKGKNFMTKWADNNVSGASFAHSPNGWTDGELGLQWMIKDFDAHTKEKAGGRTRVLLMDGHSSHYTLELLKYARANNICILGYPPHCTHALQGLDVVCFAKLKKEFHMEIQQFEALHRSRVMKADFAGVFGRAFLRAFTEETVRAAFEATGIWPFNPDAVAEKHTKPSLATFTKSGFPLQQPSLHALRTDRRTLTPARVVSSNLDTSNTGCG